MTGKEAALLPICESLTQLVHLTSKGKVPLNSTGQETMHQAADTRVLVSASLPAAMHSSHNIFSRVCPLIDWKGYNPGGCYWVLSRDALNPALSLMLLSPAP